MTRSIGGAVGVPVLAYGPAGSMPAGRRRGGTSNPICRGVPPNGALGGVRLRTPRAEVVRLWGDGLYRVAEHQPQCVYGHYGDVLLIFRADSQELVSLEIDFSQGKGGQPTLANAITLDSWKLRGEMSEEELLPALQEAGLHYTSEFVPADCYQRCRWCRWVYVRLTSGVEIEFAYDDVRFGLQSVRVQSAELERLLEPGSGKAVPDGGSPATQ